MRPSGTEPPAAKETPQARGKERVERKDCTASSLSSSSTCLAEGKEGGGGSSQSMASVSMAPSSMAPSTFESSPSKSVADFQSVETTGMPSLAATSELEAKLRQRMLKCEGRDVLYRPQPKESLSCAPARLKNTILKRNSEHSLNGVMLDELQRTASLQRCTRARSGHSFSRSKAKSSGADPARGGHRPRRPHSYIEAREARELPLHYRDSAASRGVRWRGRRRETGSFEKHASPLEKHAAASPLPAAAGRSPMRPLLLPLQAASPAPGDRGASSTPPRASDYDSVTSQEHEALQSSGVAMYALDDPTRDATEESSVDVGASSLLDARRLEEDEEAPQQDSLSVEEYLFDLVNHVPPNLAQKMGLILQQLQERKSLEEGAETQGTELSELELKPGEDSLETEAPTPGPCTSCINLHLQLEHQRRLVRQLEEEVEHQAHQSDALQEAAALTQELADCRARECRAEQCRRATESRAEMEATRLVAEMELLRTLLAGEQAKHVKVQAQLLGTRARLEEAEWHCERLQDENQSSFSEALNLHVRMGDVDSRLLQSEQRAEQSREELSRSRRAQSQLKQELLAAHRELAAAEELAEADKRLHLGKQQQLQLREEERGAERERARLAQEAAQREAAEALAKQLARALEQELRAELAQARGEAQECRREAGEAAESARVAEAEVAAAREEGARCREELRGAACATAAFPPAKGKPEKRPPQDECAGQLAELHVEQAGWQAEVRTLCECLESADLRLAREESAQALLRNQLSACGRERDGLREELAQGLQERSQHGCRMESECVRWAAEREAIFKSLAVASADCVRSRQEEAVLAGQLAGLKHLLTQEQRELQEERELNARLLSEDLSARRLDTVALELQELAAEDSKLSEGLLSSVEEKLASSSVEMLELEEACRGVDQELACQARALEQSNSWSRKLQGRTKAAVSVAEDLKRLLSSRAAVQVQELRQVEMRREELEAQSSLLALSVAGMAGLDPPLEGSLLPDVRTQARHLHDQPLPKVAQATAAPFPVLSRVNRQWSSAGR